MKNTINAIITGTATIPTGCFYSAHISAHGKKINSRWESYVAIHSSKNKPIFMRVVAWDVKDNPMGTYLSMTTKRGMKIKLDVELASYNKKVFIDNIPVKDKNGNQVMRLAHHFIVTKVYKKPLWERVLFSIKKLFENNQTVLPA